MALPEGHKPVCRACYDLECEMCSTGMTRGTEAEGWFRKCECACSGNEVKKES